MLVEYMKKRCFKLSDLEVLPEGRAWLVAEFGADTADEAGAKASALIEKVKPSGHACNLVKDKAKQREVWDVRDAALAVTAHIPGESATWPGWEDSAVRPDDLGRYLRELKALFHQHGYDASVYGHVGDGLVHCRINFDLSSEEGLKNWQGFLDEAADLVVQYGGSISGEHGDGEARGALLERMYGADLLAAQREFRAIWDPCQRINPGKILDPYPITANLRVGSSYRPPEIKGLFAYPEDDRSFTKATLRCVGVGKMPPPRHEGRRYVPKLPRHQRREIFDTRPSSAAVRNGARGRARGRVRRRGCGGGARSLSRLQGLQIRHRTIHLWPLRPRHGRHRVSGSAPPDWVGFNAGNDPKPGLSPNASRRTPRGHARMSGRVCAYGNARARALVREFQHFRQADVRALTEWSPD